MKRIVCNLFFLLVAASLSAASVQLGRFIRAGKMNSLCLPFDIQEEQIGKLYAIGSISADGVARIYEVSQVSAGQPFVVCPNRTMMTVVSADDAVVSTSDPEEQPLLWDGGTISGSFDNYDWQYSDLEGNWYETNGLRYEQVDITNLDLTVNLENIQVRRFLSQVNYTKESPSLVYRYNRTPPKHRDYPNSVCIPIPENKQNGSRIMFVNIANEHDAGLIELGAGITLAEIKNLVPQQTYRYQVVSANKTVARGYIHTEGHLRMIEVPVGGFNIRDLGGWLTSDGRRIKYGRLFRGSELNGAHIADYETISLLKRLGVGAEIDFRYRNENQGAGLSVFGFKSKNELSDDSTPTYLFTDNLNIQIYSFNSTYHMTKMREAFLFMLSNLKEGRGVYQHCIWGADRTGLFSMLLEGLLGVDYDGLMKDYELSCMVGTTRNKTNREDVINYIQKLKGETLQQKFNTFFLEKVKVSQQEIDDFRTEMLGEEDITVSLQSPVSHQQPLVVNYDLFGRKVTKNSNRRIIRKPCGQLLSW